jgi:hypothetical protein
MKNLHYLMLLAIIPLSLFLGYSQVFAFQVSVSPPEINQGDVFMVKVTEVDNASTKNPFTSAPAELAVSFLSALWILMQNLGTIWFSLQLVIKKQP